MASNFLNEITFQMLQENQRQTEKLDSTNNNISEMSSNLSSFLDAFRSEKLKGREGEIEGGKGKGSSTPAGGDTSAGAAGGGLLGGILAKLTGTVAAIVAGLAGTMIAGFTEFGNDISRTVASIFLIEKYTPIFEKLGGLFGENGIIGKFFTDIRKSILRMMYIGEDGKAISKVFAGTKGAQGAGPIAKTFRIIRNVYNVFEEFIGSPLMKGMGKMLGIFGTVLKKIFLPIGLIFTAYDTIKGAIEGYEEDGFVGALTGAVGGLLSSIVGAPLNLIKSMTSWLLEKLGFEDASKFLDEEVDFEQMIKNFFKDVAKFVTKAFGVIGEFLANPGEALANAGETVWTGIKNMFSGEDESPNQAPKTVDEFADAMDVQQRFMGGPVESGRDYIVGEKGPELFMPKSTGSIVSNDMMGGMMKNLGSIMKAGAPMAAFGQQKGKELKAKEDAMRAAGASDMEIAQSMMGDMGGIMGGLKGAVSAGGLDKLKMPKMDMGGVKDMMSPSNLGNIFGGMVKENEEAKRAQAKQPAPVVIQDNSNRTSSSSSTAMPVMSTPYDFNDPFVAGLRT